MAHTAKLEAAAGLLPEGLARDATGLIQISRISGPSRRQRVAKRLAHRGEAIRVAVQFATLEDGPLIIKGKA
jgi:hypothetical protein